MQNKIDKALHGPGVLEVALGAALALVLGVGVAGVFLVFKPVKTVKEPPKEVEAGVIYFQPGSENANKGRGWQQKQQSLLARGPVELTEDELNAWSAAMNPKAAAKPGNPAKPLAPAKPGAKPGPAAAAPAPTAFLTTGTVNFRLQAGKLQLAVKCVLSAAGFSQEVWVVATGGFRQSGGRFVFEAETLYLGSCPLHKIPGATAPLLGRFAALQPLPAEMRAAWDRLTAVELTGSTLRLAAQ